MYSEPIKKLDYLEIEGQFFFVDDYPYCPECGEKSRCGLQACQLADQYAAFHTLHRDSPSLAAYRSYGLITNAKCYLSGTFGDPDDATIECGDALISDGIGLAYQIFGNLDSLSSTMLSRYRANSIANNSVWKHDVSVLIWAPTGRGKNYFVENQLLPYVQTLNEISERRRRVLMLVNRVALKGQIDEHLAAGEVSHLNNFTDVMTYQSLLAQSDYLRRRQAEDPYVYVICDEAHFFTSDAMFNADTDRILSTIEEVFCKSMRVYMTATPYDCIIPLRTTRIGKSIPSYGPVTLIDPQPEDYNLDRLMEYAEPHMKIQGYKGIPDPRIIPRKDPRLRIYHFAADYGYLDIQPFIDLDALIPAITSSVVERGEKWIVFVDNKKKLEALEGMIRQALKDAGYASGDDPILRVSANDKKDQRFQKMIEQEALPEGVCILLTTSVLDNGVNIWGVQNVVVSTMDKVKCLQMVGRARVKEGERKTLYLKRFSISEVKSLLQDIQDRTELYLDFEDLYVNGSPQNQIDFLQKNLMNPNSVKAGYLFRWESVRDSSPYSSSDEPQGRLVKNEIAYNLTRDRKIALQQILAEMQGEDASGLTVGDKFLAHQFSWFGKEYDPSITPLTTYLSSLHPDEANARTKIVSVASGQQNAIERKEFHREFIWRYELSYGPFDRSKKLNLKTYNSYLAKMNLPFRLVSSKENKDDWECRRPSLAETDFEAFTVHVASTLLEQDAQKASINSIETDFEVHHEYAVRCIERFEEEGVVSAQNGKQPRTIDRVKLQEFVSANTKINVTTDSVQFIELKVSLLPAPHPTVQENITAPSRPNSIINPVHRSKVKVPLNVRDLKLSSNTARRSLFCIPKSSCQTRRFYSKKLFDQLLAKSIVLSDDGNTIKFIDPDGRLSTAKRYHPTRRSTRKN